MSNDRIDHRAPTGQRLLVTGASGLLGLNLALDAARQGYAVTGLVNANHLKGTPFEVRPANLEGHAALLLLLDEVRPDLVVHCAALANLEECEADPDRAERINAVLPGTLAAECARRNIQLIHISTDAVFDGVRGFYKEDDDPHPLGVYAHTKLAGEKAVLEADPQAIVARVNFFGWSLSGKRSLAEFFVNHLSAGRPVKGFTDVFFCPLLVHDLGCLLLQMADLRLSGIYHVVGSENLSKYEFGLRLAKQFGLDERLVLPSSVADGNLVARRAPNLQMDVTQLLHALGAPLPTLASGLQKFYDLYREGYPVYLRSLVDSPV